MKRFPFKIQNKIRETKHGLKPESGFEDRGVYRVDPLLPATVVSASGGSTIYLRSDATCL